MDQAIEPCDLLQLCRDRGGRLLAGDFRSCPKDISCKLIINPLEGFQLRISLLVLLVAFLAPATASVDISAVNFDAPGNDHNNLNGEWVQMTNSGATSVSLNGWTLSDEGVKHLYRFPMFSLDPGASVRVYTGCGSNTANSLYWCRSQAVWNNDGDTATLADAQGNVVDQWRG